MFLEALRRRRRLDAPAAAIYAAIVAQARDPRFYRDLEVPDTPEGRFEMIALHMFLVLKRLKETSPPKKRESGALGQALFDLMFADMDRNLREMGTGDLGVARRVKALAQGFFGRIAAYDRGLEEGAAGLASSLERNVYGDSVPADVPLALAAYMAESMSALRRLPLEAIEAGGLAFASLDTAAAGAVKTESDP